MPRDQALTEDFPAIPSPPYPCSPKENTPLLRLQQQREKDARAIRKLVRAAILCFVFMCVEFGGGIWAHSLAVMTDAAHLLSDIVAFAISIFAIMISRRESTLKMSFGFGRVEILGATFSIFVIWTLTAYLVFEAINRLIEHDSKVNGKIMFITASFGLAVNIVMAFILGHEGHGHSHGLSNSGHSHGDGEGGGGCGGHGHSHGCGGSSSADYASFEGHSHDGPMEGGGSSSTAHDVDNDQIGHQDLLTSAARKRASENLNVRAAFIHVIGDFVQTIGVFTAAAIIWHDQSYWYVDPICTFLFSILVLLTTVPILKESLMVLMESTPAGILAEDVEDTLIKIKGVAEVHDLHIWTIGSGKIALAVHLSHDPTSRYNSCDILHAAQTALYNRYGIDHSTIQVEECRILDCISDIGCGQTIHAHRSAS